MNNPQKPIKVYVPVEVAFDENGLSIPFQQLDVHLPAPTKTE